MAKQKSRFAVSLKSLTERQLRATLGYALDDLAEVLIELRRRAADEDGK